MNKSLMVAQHEFLKNVKRKEFILLTLGLPVFFILIMVGPILLISSSLIEDQTIGYIDQSNSFQLPEKIVKELPPMGPLGAKNYTLEFIRYSEIDDARMDLDSDMIDTYLIIPADYHSTGIIKSYSNKKDLNLPEKEISESMIDSLLKDKVDDDTLQRVKEPVKIQAFIVNRTGETQDEGFIIFDFGLPFISGMLLFISIFSASGYLLRGIIEEKQNRVIEILLSSATPVELLTGKIIGLGAVGLAQITVWLSVGSIGTLYILPLLIKPSLLIMALIYFILGFLLYASIMAGIGAVSGSMEESQQIMVIFTITAISPIMFMQILITRPDSALAVFLSMFPLTSPVAMPGRIAAADVPFYEIIGSILIIAVSVYLVIIFSARMFRAGLLMYGKRPNIREIIRYLRAG